MATEANCMCGTELVLALVGYRISGSALHSILFGKDREMRQSLAAFMLVFALLFTAPLISNAQDITVGFIYVGPKDDYGYNQAHAEGAAAVKKMAGVKVL